MIAWKLQDSCDVAWCDLLCGDGKIILEVESFTIISVYFFFLRVSSHYFTAQVLLLSFLFFLNSCPHPPRHWLHDWFHCASLAIAIDITIVFLSSFSFSFSIISPLEQLHSLFVYFHSSPPFILAVSPLLLSIISPIFRPPPLILIFSLVLRPPPLLSVSTIVANREGNGNAPAILNTRSSPGPAVWFEAALTRERTQYSILNDPSGLGRGGNLQAVEQSEALEEQSHCH